MPPPETPCGSWNPEATPRSPVSNPVDYPMPWAFLRPGGSTRRGHPVVGGSWGRGSCRRPGCPRESSEGRGGRRFLPSARRASRLANRPMGSAYQQHAVVAATASMESGSSSSNGTPSRNVPMRFWDDPLVLSSRSTAALRSGTCLDDRRRAGSGARPERQFPSGAPARSTSALYESSPRGRAVRPYVGCVGRLRRNGADPLTAGACRPATSPTSPGGCPFRARPWAADLFLEAVRTRRPDDVGGSTCRLVASPTGPKSAPRADRSKV